MRLEAAIQLTRPISGYDPDEARDQSGKWATGGQPAVSDTKPPTTTKISTAFGTLSTPGGKHVDGTTLHEQKVMDRKTGEATLARLQEKYPQVVALLDKAPLAGTTWVRDASDQLKMPRPIKSSGGLNGFYDNWNTNIVLSTSDDTYHIMAARKWNPKGDNFNTQDGMSIDDARVTTLIHEIGHHLDHQFMDPELKDDDTHTNWQARRKLNTMTENVYSDHADRNAKTLTEYGKTNSSEYFGETFAAYFTRKNDLQKVDPMGYKMVGDVIEAIQSGKVKPIGHQPQEEDVKF